MSTVKLIVLLGLGILLKACQSEPSVSTDLVNIPGSAEGSANVKLPVITFKEAVFDFGSVAEGEVIRHVVEFENTGDAPLILSTIETSCGCTVAKNWPREPLSPGDEGSFSVEFDTNRRPGLQSKTVTVLANTVPARNEVKIKGTVVGPDTSSENL